MPLIGVFPENEIELPKINPTSVSPNQLTNGHSHLFMLCKATRWGDEARLKYEIAKKYFFFKKFEFGSKNLQRAQVSSL